jgi:hypothetical protein
VTGEGAGDRDPLLLATGKLGWQLVEQVGAQADAGREFFGGLGAVEQLDGPGEHLPYGAARVQRGVRILEHQLGGPAIVCMEPDLALVAGQARDGQAESGLTAARSAHQADHLAAPDGERHVPQDRPALVGLADMLDRDQRVGGRSRAARRVDPGQRRDQRLGVGMLGREQHVGGGPLLD